MKTTVKLIDETGMRAATGPSGAPERPLLSSSRKRRATAPIWMAQGTGLPSAAAAAAFEAAPAALVDAHVRARSTDLPGSPARGAPV